MDVVFKNLHALANDKKFMAMLHATYADDKQELCNDKNENDYSKIVNFYDDLHAYNNMFMWPDR